VVIEQGIEIRRPSRITVQASGAGSGDAYGAAAEVNEVMVSGRTIAVAEGRFFLP
jgi:predicted PhzF superfamily epimerase YddE/YHI9